MEENRNKFVCKVCRKIFLSGKALGGHIRSHKYGQQTLEAKEPRINNKRDLGDESGGNSGNVLRENPIKSRWFSGSSITDLNQQKLCKECGKGFSSLKALCGHMACHSEKEKNKVTKNGFKYHSGSGGNPKLVIDDQSDTETSGPGGHRRSKRLRSKAIGTYSSLSNGSLSDSDREQGQEEEVVISLLMLSRDLDSAVESSENHPMTVHGNSSSIEVKIDSKNGLISGTIGNELVALKRTRDGNGKGSELGLTENFDSGYFRNGPRKVDSDVSVDGFHRNLKIKKPNGKFCCQFEDLDAEMGKSLINYKGKKFEFSEKYLIGEGGNEVDGTRTRGKNEDDILIAPHSLGASRASHNKINVCWGSMNESSKDSVDYEYVPAFMGNNATTLDSFREKKLLQNVEKEMVSKKGKALCGHKRPRFVGGYEDRTVVIEQEVSKMPSLIDLNLPAPMEEDAFTP